MSSILRLIVLTLLTSFLMLGSINSNAGIAVYFGPDYDDYYYPSYYPDYYPGYYPGYYQNYYPAYYGYGGHHWHHGYYGNGWRGGWRGGPGFWGFGHHHH